MKQIIAYIKPHKLENVMLALHKIEGLTGICVLEIRGCGRSRKQSPDFIFDVDSFNLVTRLKLKNILTLLVPKDHLVVVAQTCCCSQSFSLPY